MSRSRVQALTAFVEAIDALGGTIDPALTHDQIEIVVHVPTVHQAKADELIKQLYADLAKLAPS